MQPGDADSELGTRLRRIAVMLGEAAHTRAALLAAELELLISSALRALLAGLAAVALATLGALVAVLAMLMAVPESDRALSAAVSAFALALSAVCLMAWSVRRVRLRPFAASLEEVREDLHRIRGAPPLHGQPGRSHSDAKNQ